MPTDLTIDSVMVTYYGGVAYRIEIHVSKVDDENYQCSAVITESRLKENSISSVETELYRSDVVVDCIDCVQAWLLLQSYLV